MSLARRREHCVEQAGRTSTYVYPRQMYDCALWACWERIASNGWQCLTLISSLFQPTIMPDREIVGWLNEVGVVFYCTPLRTRPVVLNPMLLSPGNEVAENVGER